MKKGLSSSRQTEEAQTRQKGGEPHSWKTLNGEGTLSE